ncbi:MAG: glycosyltransferase, partial [Gemmatimonadales bacterium]
VHTVGLVLWKIRRTFIDFPREYQILVADDGSTDQTAEVLEPYTSVLPLTVIRHAERKGYAATVEELLKLAVERTDRPKRDCAVIMHADFSHGTEFLPDMVRRIESGADMVVADGVVEGEPSRGLRWVRRVAPWLLRPAVRIPGVRDVVSGYAAFRLVTLRNAFRAHDGPLLTTDGWAANAELFARAAAGARRIETIDAVERRDLRQRATRRDPWRTFREVWDARRRLRVPPPAVAPARRSTRRTPEEAAP